MESKSEDETKNQDKGPLYVGGSPNMGFFPIRWSAGGKPDPQRLRDAAARLGRSVSFTYDEGYQCELIAAATDGARLAYVESTVKIDEDSGGVDVHFCVHQLLPDGTHRIAEVESYNPYFGCDVRFLEWVQDRKAVLVYREKHDTYACCLGDVWPPRFVVIKDEWVIRDNVLAFIGYKETKVQRLSFPNLEPLAPLEIGQAKELGSMPDVREWWLADTEDEDGEDDDDGAEEEDSEEDEESQDDQGALTA